METLVALGPTLEGKSERQQNPHPARGLVWAAWIIARLGGWNCYYKLPGPITFRRGVEQFHTIRRGRMLEMRLQREARIPCCESGNPEYPADNPQFGAGCPPHAFAGRGFSRA
jgi:hypothetical protein